MEYVKTLQKNEHGFTLIEMCVVLSVTLLLTGIVGKVSYEKFNEYRIEQYAVFVEFKLREAQNHAIAYNMPIYFRRTSITLDVRTYDATGGEIILSREPIPSYIRELRFTRGETNITSINFGGLGNVNSIYKIIIAGDNKSITLNVNLMKGRITRG